MTSQRLLLHFFNRKVPVTEPEKSDEIIEIPCSSNLVKNTEIEINTDTPDLTDIRDICLYINKRISDDKFKYDLLKKPWQPPTSYKFPVISTRKLKFQLSWITRFSWLIYSSKLEGAFCKICVLFSNETSGKGSSVKVGAFVNKPFIKWKNALECFITHSNADYHKLSTLRAEKFVKIIENKTFDVAA
jgi:hypothetical protein